MELSLCSTRTVLGLMMFGRFTEVVLKSFFEDVVDMGDGNLRLALNYWGF